MDGALFGRWSVGGVRDFYRVAAHTVASFGSPRGRRMAWNFARVAA